MREFNYRVIKETRWDSEILGLVAAIYKEAGKQEVYLKQRPEELETDDILLFHGAKTIIDGEIRAKANEADYIIVPIADNRMYQIIDSFIDGEITAGVKILRKIRSCQA